MVEAYKWGAATALCLAALTNGAAAAEHVVPPPISTFKSNYLNAHPQARAAYIASLPRLAETASPTIYRVVPPKSGSWAAVATAPGGASLSSPVLLTDGTVMLQSANSPSWYKLTPDSKGNYATGTWSQLASLPVISGTQYAPLYHATAVLPDGRVIIMGGEYNGSGTEVWTNLGAIYNPVTNSWAAVTAPGGSAWTQIGDAESTVLANGTFMLASCCGYPDADALLNPTTLTWTATGAPTGNDGTDPAIPYQDEQGYELLPNHDVLTIDIWSTNEVGTNPTNTELYNPTTGVWTAGGNTPTSLVDPEACGNYEIGPAIMRGNGTLVAFGGNTGCTTPTADPSAIYNTATGVWTAGPNVPATCGSGGTSSCTLADAPAALLSDGNVLFAASAGYAQSPTHFFELNGSNKIGQVADPLFNASSSSSYYYNFLDLPNGQILVTDFSNVAEVYTPSGAISTVLMPVITSVATTLGLGDRYPITGKQLNGRSQGASYGDDAQMSTNYPLVRITNNATGNVVYARTTGFTTASIAINQISSAYFVVPTTTGKGASTLQVVASGVASAATAVTIK